jgi:hypothetical protein
MDDSTFFITIYLSSPMPEYVKIEDVFFDITYAASLLSGFNTSAVRITYFLAARFPSVDTVTHVNQFRKFRTDHDNRYTLSCQGIIRLTRNTGRAAIGAICA